MEIVLYQAPKEGEKREFPFRITVDIGSVSGGRQVGQAPHFQNLGACLQRWRTAGWAGVLSSTSEIRKVAGQAFCLPPRSQSFLFLRTLSLILISFSIAGLILYVTPLATREIRYRVEQMTKSKVVAVEPKKEPQKYPDLVAPDPNFSLVIPKIDAKSPIIANVNPASAKEYNKALKQGVGHATGTFFPGMAGTIWLFAHSTDAPWNIGRYNAVFFLVKDLEAGDDIIVFFKGQRYDYAVFEKRITSLTDTSWLNSNSEVLVLQTCYPPGTTQKALLVFAKRTGV